MTEVLKLMPIFAFAGTPVLLFAVWFCCGGSVGFENLGESYDHHERTAITEEEINKLRRAMEDHLITTQFKKESQHASLDDNGDVETGNPVDENGESSAPSCSICLAEYVENDLITHSTHPDCQHVFHKHCIVEWIVARAGQADCPICRREFLTRMDDETSADLEKSQHGGDDDAHESSSLGEGGERDNLANRNDNDTSSVNANETSSVNANETARA